MLRVLFLSYEKAVAENIEDACFRTTKIVASNKADKENKQTNNKQQTTNNKQTKQNKTCTHNTTSNAYRHSCSKIVQGDSLYDE